MDLNPRKALLGLLLGLGGHSLAFAAGFLAARLVQPSTGGGFEDLASVVLAFIGVELLLALAAIISGLVLLVKGARDLGGGILAGWLIGVITIVVLVQAQ